MSNQIAPSGTDAQPLQTGTPAEHLAKMVTLLEENRTYLKKLVEFKEKEERQKKMRLLWQVISTILPYLVPILFAYYLYSITNAQFEELKKLVTGWIPSMDSLKNIKF